MTTTATVPPPTAPAGSGARFRRWRGLDDIDGMAAANGRLRAQIGLLEPIEPEAMRHRYTHLVNSDPATDCIVVERDGATRGYARVEWHDLVDGSRIYDTVVVLEPACWGLGLSEAMLAWCEDRSRELAREHPTTRPAFFQAYAFGGDEAAVAANEALGYVAVRWDAEMLRPDLGDIPVIPLADGYTLRTPEPDELPAVHAMMVASFQEHWGEAEAGDWHLEEWIEDPRFRRDLVVVAWLRSEPVACVTNLLEPAPDGTVRGLLDSVCTHPQHRRLGLARACIARSLELLRAAGAGSAYLGVDTDNHNQALTLYESCGFRVASRSATYRRPFQEPRP